MIRANTAQAAVFAYLERLAIAGEQIPRDLELAAGADVSLTGLYDSMVKLKRGRYVEVKRMGNHRQVTILTGEHAGKSTAPRPDTAPMYRLFAAISEFAAQGLPLPDEGAIAQSTGLNRSGISSNYNRLRKAGFIRMERGQAQKDIVVVILQGEHAGKKTAPRPVIVKPKKEAKPQKPRTILRPYVPGPPPAEGEKVCKWCEGPVGKKPHSKNVTDCCSVRCAMEWAAVLWSGSRRQIHERMAHIEHQPKGCATVEEFLARGGQVYREDGGRDAIR